MCNTCWISNTLCTVNTCRLNGMMCCIVWVYENAPLVSGGYCPRFDILLYSQLYIRLKLLSHQPTMQFHVRDGHTISHRDVLWNHVQCYQAFCLWLVVLEGRRNGVGEPSHVINIDIQDNHEEATIGAFMICDLCAMVSSPTMWYLFLDLLLTPVSQQCLEWDNVP